jgi:hypothetical protein
MLCGGVRAYAGVAVVGYVVAVAYVTPPAAASARLSRKQREPTLRVSNATSRVLRSESADRAGNPANSRQ